MVIKCIKFIFGNGRILSGFGYIAVGWIVAKKKILSGRISIILGLILLGALYLAGDTWGFLLKFLIAEILLSASCKVTLPQHPIWEHMRYVSEMRIDDIFVRYLMQYEILLGQVTNEHTQKEVTDYIKKVYNPANKDRQIGFQLTRRPRRKYKEDDLTYNRNLLGHGDIEKAVSEEKIRQLSRSIMDVLWFSLWNKAE